MVKDRKQKRRIVKFFAALMLVFSMSAALYLGWQAYRELSERKAGASYYDELAGVVDVRPNREDGSQSEADENPGDGETATGEENGSEIDFELLKATCPDVVGWIRLDDTNIDYPVVQGKDNFFYMDHLPDGTANSAGSIMMDVSNAEDFSDTITVLHGHHMRNGNMFGNLEKLANDGYFEEHPVFHLYMLDGDHLCEVIAGWTASARVSGYPISFEDEGSFRSFVENGRKSAVYSADAEAQWTDRYVLLSTCAYSFTNARFIVLARIL